jgi:hypothetical protein
MDQMHEYAGCEDPENNRQLWGDTKLAYSAITKQMAGLAIWAGTWGGPKK